MKRKVFVSLALSLVLLAVALPISTSAEVGRSPQQANLLATEACGWIPDDVSGTITPKCGDPGTKFTLTVSGFLPNEPVGYWLDGDHGIIIGTIQPYAADSAGRIEDFWFYPYELALEPGLYFWVFEGVASGHQAIVYFRVVEYIPPVDDCGWLPDAVSGDISPRCGTWDTEFTIAIWGFLPFEPIGYWLDGEHGIIAGTGAPDYVSFWGSMGELTFYPYEYGLEPGLYFWVFEGIVSGHQAIVYFRVNEKVVPTPDDDCGWLPEDVRGDVSPRCGGSNTEFSMEVWGFWPFEPVGYWLDGEHGVIAGTVSAPIIDYDGQEKMWFYPWEFDLEPGLYYWVFEGVKSGHKAIVYFRVTE